MRFVAHKIKTYRRAFHPLPPSTLKSRIFALLAVQITVTVAGLIYYFFMREGRSAVLLPAIYFSELMAGFGYLQLMIEREKRRYQVLTGRPAARARVAVTEVAREKARMIERLFSPSESFEQLARSLSDGWEWRKAIHKRAGDPAKIKVGKFLGLPSGSTLATYLGGLFAIIAAIAFTGLDREALYGNIPNLWKDFTLIWWNLMKITLLMAFAAIPLGMIASVLQLSWQWLGQSLDDDYLSDRSFYRFIRELVEMADWKERRLVMTTVGIAYWLVTVGTSPLGELKKRRQVLRRARTIARLKARNFSSSIRPGS